VRHSIQDMDWMCSNITVFVQLLTHNINFDTFTKIHSLNAFHQTSGLRIGCRMGQSGIISANDCRRDPGNSYIKKL
jgi:hypothetical protein